MRLATGLLLTASVFGQNRAPAIETIRKEELKADLFFLASDAMRGRLTGTPEYALAAEWIAARYARLGLEPLAPDGSFFHRFDLVLSRLAEGSRLIVATGPESRRVARQGEDFYPLIFSADAEARGRVVCKGFGIAAPDLNWDDYRGHSIRGSIVMIFDDEPAPGDANSPFDGLVTSEYANSLRKTLAAQAQGATGVLFVNARAHLDDRATRSFASAARAYWPAKPPVIERYTLATYADRVRIPALQISPALAEQIIGRKLSGLLSEAEQGRAASESDLTIEMAASLQRTVIADRSVVGKIEGADPNLKNEAILITAHYDHNGADGVQIFNGADDNASGSVAVLDIAEAYVTAGQQGRRPRRTVIFAIWGSEERCCGPLLGSWAWVEHPLWPLNKTVAALNMDMIGRSEEVPEIGGPRFKGLKPQTAASNANSVHVMGYSFSPDLAAVLREANREIDLTLRLDYDNNSSNLLRRSDQWPFLQRGIPAVFLHTGLHPDYHTTSDRPEKIDYSKVERIARLVYQASWNLAQSESRPKLPKRRQIPPPQD
ncbi:MAG TPA: M28 family peptidase [Bryobacteraceae bacterium]|nr:M28 family peptidase [Bryobacteraceae bacterium]